MKKTLLILGLMVFGFFAYAQDAPDYLMYETMLMTPKPGHGAKLEKALKAHNDKFHSQPGYEVGIWSVVNGVNSGKYLWVMGPTTWTAQDSRPTGDDHNDDWSANVEPYIAEYGPIEYWKNDASLSYFPADFKLEKMRVWFADVNPFEGYRVNGFLKKIRATMASTDELDTPFGVYWNDQANSEGRDLALVWFFDKWSWMDEDGKFVMHYEKLHGTGSWVQAMDEWRDAIGGLDEELRVFVAGASSAPGVVSAPPAAETSAGSNE